MSGATGTGGPSGWGVGLLLAVVAITVRALTHPSATMTPEPVAASPAPMVTTDAAPPAVTPPEVSRADVDRAARHVGLALGADGAAGAWIYSVNCYASLGRAFAVAVLDRCGAFDVLAARQAIDPFATAEAAVWFEAGAARRRFMDAASAGGLSAEDAAARLSSVGEMTKGAKVEPVAPPPAVVADGPLEPPEPDGTEAATAGEESVAPQDDPDGGGAEPDGE